MQSISAAVARLQEVGARFARHHELRLLVVRISGDMRPAVLQLLPALELHADNRSPWVVLEDARTAGDDGWLARSIRLLEDFERRRAAFAQEGVELGEIAAPQLPVRATSTQKRSILGWLRGAAAAGPSPRLEVFARTAADVLRALRPPLRGLVIVLAPVVVESADALWAELELLLGRPELEECRFAMVMDAGEPFSRPPPRLLESIGGRALEHECVVDQGQVGADLAAVLERSGCGAGAGPRNVVPPRRVNAPPELPEEQRQARLREAGVEPAILEEAPRLGQLLLGAALAMREQRGPDVVRLQREAKELARRLGQHELAVIAQVGLASYLSALGRRELAVAELEDAARYAELHGLPGAQSQALLALGFVHALGKVTQLPAAAHAYVRAAKAAEAGGEPLLAIEGFRLAGQLAVQLKVPPQAIACFGEALRVARANDAELVEASSAAEAARQLSKLLGAQGLPTQSALMAEQAERLEHGELGVGGGPRTEEMEAFELPVLALPAGRTLEMDVLEVLTRRTQEMDALVLPGDEPPEREPRGDESASRSAVTEAIRAPQPDASEMPATNAPPPPPVHHSARSIEMDAFVLPQAMKPPVVRLDVPGWGALDLPPRDPSLPRTMELDAIDDDEEGA